MTPLSSGPGTSANAVVERHRTLVRYVVDRLGASLSGVFDADDAMQAGLVALVAAQATYRDDRGASFETYAVIRIRGAILDAVRALDPVSRTSRANARAIGVAASALAGTLGRPATDHEIATLVGIPVASVVQRRAAARTVTVSLDMARDGADPSDSPPLADGLPDPRADDPGERAALREELATLVQAVTRLGERNQRVIALYYRDELTFREIAGLLGVSESRACQIHRGALERLREGLSAGIPIGGVAPATA